MRSAVLAFATRTCWRTAATSQAHSFRPRAQFPSRRHISTDQTPRRPVARLLEWKPQEGDSDAKDVVVNGFVRSVRAMKSRSFVALGDGSSLAPLQAIVPMNQAEGCDPYSPTRLSRLSSLLLIQIVPHSLSIGAAIRMRGAWVPSPGAGQSHELHVDSVQVMGPSDAKVSIVSYRYAILSLLLCIRPAGR